MLTSLDLSHRSSDPELMDSVGSFPEYAALIRGLSRTDRLVLAHRPTFAFLNGIDRVLPRDAPPIHIVDVGCGNGDLLRRIGRWARRRRRRVALTGVDLNPYAIRAANELSGSVKASTPVTWINADILSLHLLSPVDLVLSCHFTHHLSQTQLVHFVRWMEETARLGWMINDLHREIAAYYAFQVFSRLTRMAPILRRDGLVSIRRAFRPCDWWDVCRSAGLDPRTYGIVRRFPARLCVERFKLTQ